jgi:hypothetical protein
VKQLLKLCPQLHEKMAEAKLHMFVTFILEREFKNNAVAKERMQCFKLMKAWLKTCPDSFPLLFA